MKARKTPFHLGETTIKDYDKTFFKMHEDLIGRVVIHHGIEQLYLSERRGGFDWKNSLP